MSQHNQYFPIQNSRSPLPSLNAWPLKMISNLEFCLLFSIIICVQNKKLFDELPSEDLKRNFDTFPLISRTVQEIDWCKVSQLVSYLLSGELVCVSVIVLIGCG